MAKKVISPLWCWSNLSLSRLTSKTFCPRWVLPKVSMKIAKEWQTNLPCTRQLSSCLNPFFLNLQSRMLIGSTSLNRSNHHLHQIMIWWYFLVILVIFLWWFGDFFFDWFLHDENHPKILGETLGVRWFLWWNQHFWWPKMVSSNQAAPQRPARSDSQSCGASRADLGWLESLWKC